MGDSLTTYDELNEDIQFTEDETKALLKLSEKEILILVLSEMKKIYFFDISLSNSATSFSLYSKVFEPDALIP